jgi:phosphoglycolate phosphatase (TIGR01487 family)
MDGRRIVAIASDYDGTIGSDDGAPASTIAALRRFKASGRKLILVTGRPLGELKQVLPEVGLFDIAVIENGGVLYFPSTDTFRALAPSPSPAFVARLREQGIAELAVGETIVATHADHHATIAGTIDDMALDLEVILNTDALMILPTGVHKAFGLTAALAELGISASDVAAIGDAENDLVFLRHCGYAVAVANAVPELKAVADLVTTAARGAGVEELVERLLA